MIGRPSPIAIRVFEDSENAFLPYLCVLEAKQPNTKTCEARKLKLRAHAVPILLAIAPHYEVSAFRNKRCRPFTDKDLVLTPLS